MCFYSVLNTGYLLVVYWYGTLLTLKYQVLEYCTIPNSQHKILVPHLDLDQPIAPATGSSKDKFVSFKERSSSHSARGRAAANSIRNPSCVLSSPGPCSRFAIAGMNFTMVLSMFQHEFDHIVVTGRSEGILNFSLGWSHNLSRLAVVVFLMLNPIAEVHRIW